MGPSYSVMYTRSPDPIDIFDHRAIAQGTVCYRFHPFPCLVYQMVLPKASTAPNCPFAGSKSLGLNCNVTIPHREVMTPSSDVTL